MSDVGLTFPSPDRVRLVITKKAQARPHFTGLGFGFLSL